MRPLALILMGAVLLRTFADPDLWGHVRFGLDMLQIWTLPRVDPYSFTQDVPWINHEWLSELAIGAAYAAGGAFGLQVLKVAILGLTFALIDGIVRRKGDAWRFGVLAACAAALLPISAAIRPQIWTVLLIVAAIRLLHAGSRAMWAIPAVFVLWANVHGGWVLGLGILATALGGQWLAGTVTPQRVVGTWLLSLVATLATPYGLELWRFIGGTVRLGRADISEWQPLWRSSPDMVGVWLGGVVLVAFACGRLRTRALPAMPTALILAVASAKVNRLVPLFVLAVVVLLAPLGTDSPHVPRDEARAAPRALIDGVGVLLGLALILPMHALTCIPVMPDHVPDPVAMWAMKAAAPRGRVVTFFDWGEPVLFHLGPALRVSVDGRRETVYSDETLAVQYGIAAGTPAGLAALARLAPEYVWLPLPHAQRTLSWLEAHGYRTDLRQAGGFVAVREDLPRISPMPAAQVTGCFPGP